MNITEQQLLVWEEIKRCTDPMDFYQFLNYWYELEVKNAWFFYPIWKDSKKLEWDNRCRAYLKRFGDSYPSPEDYKLEIMRIHEQQNGDVRTIARHMASLYRYAFLHGVRLGKLVGQPPFSTRERLALRSVRKKVISIFTEHKVDIMKRVEDHTT